MRRFTTGILAATAVVLAFSGCAGPRPYSTQPEPLIRLRLAHDAQAPGTQRMERVGSGEAYFVTEDDVISDDHIESARAVETATGLNITLRLTEEGVTRLRETTRSHMGERLAILVDSRLMSAPVIRSEIGSPDATVGLTLPADDARSIAAAIATRFESGDPM